MNICVISGSTLGGAEYVAEHLEDVLKTQNFSTDLILFLKASCQNLLCKRLLSDKITRLFALGEKNESCISY